MNKIMSLVFLLISFGLFSQTKATELIFVSENKENFPQQLGNTSEYNIEKPGVAVEFLKKLETALNLKIIFLRMPWKKCLEDDLKNGKADGAFLASYKKEREEFGVYPMKDGKPDADKRVTTTAYVFCKVKDSKVDWDGSKVLNLTGNIGAPLGYSIVGDLKNMGYPIVETDDARIGLRQLLTGRLEMFASLDDQAEFIINNDPALKSKIEIIKKPIVTKPYYLMLSKQFIAKNPELAEKIWNTIKILKDKEYAKLAEKYFK
jgi:polar amino acid transport system substrate-binding protein